MSANVPTVPGHFGKEVSKPYDDNVPENLKASTSRLQFPPSYVVVGVYRLITDKSLRVPAWDKLKHGVVRGATVALIWATATFKLQRVFVELFLVKSPSVTGLSKDAVFGIHMPFDLPAYATLVFISSQATTILYFFLSRNMRVARSRAYEQTIVSRGKGPDFWQPYVEEWDNPPQVKRSKLSKFASSSVGRTSVKLLLAPLHLIPAVGIIISAWLRGLGTASYLHKPYFKAKGMSKEQVATFIQERKWDYRAFGFTAAVLEGIPLIGFIFTISNQIGAAMWAHDLEKRQHYIAELKSHKTR
ncbi:hypothetical protein BDY19DRAFT_907993 [Irpex rosettiformis]|uniref:Uncharacterized protein n=1 Tax=Irpex rosettiformis TaxID=378272 RepID=A0ACB8TXK5_9APHY|nr:hypothetical protein BDY19DRAFT_907993 [Irpex rosettiformis]